MSPTGGDQDIRIGDVERDQAVAQLREQYALGRLETAEFEQRLEASFAAKTVSDLRALVVDLPSSTEVVDWRLGSRPPVQPVGGFGKHDDEAASIDAKYGRRARRWHRRLGNRLPGRAGESQWRVHRAGLFPLLSILAVFLFLGVPSVVFLVMQLMIVWLVMAAAFRATVR